MTPGTENAITMDANTFNYLISYLANGHIPSAFQITRMDDFVKIIDNHKLAINDFIRTEFHNCTSSEFSKRWLKEKHKNGTVEVPFGNFPLEKRNVLRNDYGFNINDGDMKYLKTCLNTIMKLFVTQNSIHFRRPHRNRKRRPMDIYLYRELDIKICSTDECCGQLQDLLNQINQTATGYDRADIT